MKSCGLALERGIVGPNAREATVSALFEEAGCVPRKQLVYRHASNVICELPGETDAVITVGGHFDFVTAGTGIVDDWSGTALLSSLYAALRGEARKHTFVFTAFAEEETGLEWLVRSYRKALSAARSGSAYRVRT